MSEEMGLEHVALWTYNLEGMKNFYCTYFNGHAGNLYTKQEKGFQSYFLSFDTGSRLELMTMPSIPNNINDIQKQYTGFIHVAFSVGGRENVDALTKRLKKDGYTHIDGPRETGDGYYESCILDPDGNRVEIVA